MSLLSNRVQRTCYLKPVLSTPLAKTKPAWLGSRIGLGIMVLPLEAKGLVLGPTGSLRVQIPTKWKGGLAHHHKWWEDRTYLFAKVYSCCSPFCWFQSLICCLESVGRGTLSTINSRIQTKTDQQLLLCVSRVLPRVTKNWRFFWGGGGQALMDPASHSKSGLPKHPR